MDRNLGTARIRIAPRHSWPRARAAIAFVALLCCAPSSAGHPDAGPGDATESQASLVEIQIAMLATIPGFVSWNGEGAHPDSSTTQIGILGEDPFGSTIRILDGEEVLGRPPRLKYARSARELNDCDIVFVSRSELHRLPGILDHFRGKPILLFSDIDEFAREGGMVGLVLVEGRVNFELNLSAAQRSNLRFDIRLLNMAREVFP